MLDKSTTGGLVHPLLRTLSILLSVKETTDYIILMKRDVQIWRLSEEEGPQWSEELNQPFSSWNCDVDRLITTNFRDPSFSY